MKLNKPQLVIFFSVFVGMLIPLISMLFTKEVKWSVYDFVLAAIVLLSAGILCEFIYRKLKTTWLKFFLLTLVLLLTIMVWIELAVGLFGTPFAGS
jgi:hypothetical protein